MEQGKNQSVSITFHAGAIPAGYRLDYEPSLFNTKEHRAIQSKTGWKEFHLLQKTTRKVLLSAYFHIADGIAKNPLRAPFGGLERSPKATAQSIFDFLVNVNHALKRDGIQQIEILCPAEIYTPHQHLVTTCLLNQGYQIVQAESGACIVVDHTSLADKMSKDKRARLRQSEKAVFDFKKINLHKLETVYSFIADCRAKQGRQLSMSFSELSKTVKALPKSFFMVGVFHDKKMIGACICVQVKAAVVYTFYSAHDSAYDKWSPRVFLLAQLYAWCQKHKIELLDLGTSALKGRPNFPLLDFKLRVGATLTPKYKFRKTLI